MARILYWVDPDSGLTESVEFDVVESETHEDSQELTRHPVETGAAVSDHATEEPTRVTLEGFVGDAPNLRIDPDVGYVKEDLSLPGFAATGTQQIPLDIPTAPLNPLSVSDLVQSGIGALKSAIAGQPKGTFRDKARRATKTLSVQLLKQNAPRDRVRDVYDKLERAYKSKALITAQTSLREHFDMILTRLPAEQSEGTGNGAAFSIDLERIRVADSATVQSPEPAEKRGAAGKSAGSRNGKPDPNADAKNDQFSSTAYELKHGSGTAP